MQKALLSLLVALLPGQASAQTQASSNSDPLTPFITFAQRQPQDIALSTYHVTPQGTPDAGKPMVGWNAEQPMPLASSMKIVVLAAYARAVAAGTLDPEEPVTLAEWESFYLPFTDGGAHAASLEALNIPADFAGQAKNSAQTVPLDTLAAYMIRTSDNAATDVLLTRLGRQALADTVTALGLSGQDEIAPIAGMFTAWDDPALNQSLLTATPQARADLAWAQAERVRQTSALRLPLRQLILARRSDPALMERLSVQTPPHGTTADYARVMAGVLSSNGFSAPELAVMRRHLGFLTEISPENAAVFEQMYLKGGSLSNMLTNNYAFMPKVGPHAGEAVVVSLFLRNISADEYTALSEQMNDALLRLALEPSAQARLAGALRQPADKQ